VFALKFMELWDRNVNLRDMFDHSDIPNICIKLGVDLFFSKGNCIDKSLLMNLYKQVKLGFRCTYLFCYFIIEFSFSFSFFFCRV